MLMDKNCDGGDKFAEEDDKSNQAILHPWLSSQQSSDLKQKAYKARCNDLHDFFGPMTELSWKEDEPASVFFFDECKKALVIGNVVRRFKTEQGVVNVPQRFSYLLSQVGSKKMQKKIRKNGDSNWEIDAEHSSTPVLEVLRLHQELSGRTGQQQ